MNTTTPALATELTRALTLLGRVAADHRASLNLREVGTVRDVGQGIAHLSGLPGVRAEELIAFPGGLLGIAFNLDAGEVGVVLLGDHNGLRAGMEARRTGRVVDVPVGQGLIGRVIDPTGKPLDKQGPLRAALRWPIERDAHAIIEREAVTVPLQTGVKVVDALIPVGRGQRELILGDRQTGKTALALDAVFHQHDQKVICIYCAIGQRSAAVAQIIHELRQRGALDYSVVVVASGEDPPGLQFIAPYAATTIGEFFMERGHDVLIVYDDLTRHAQAYRELSLLLRRPPGREAFPGDIFYIHSRLLERSTRLKAELGGGSLTALPIAETEAQNLSAYVPTNLISITDGQIYLSPELYQKGILPAVDVGASVSRVGGKAQLPAYRAVAGDLRLAYSQFGELEVFARFGTRLDEDTRKLLERGQRVRETLKQRQYDTLASADQVAVLLAVTAGLFDPLPLARIPQAEEAVRRAVKDELPALHQAIGLGKVLQDEERATLIEVSQRALATVFGAEFSAGD